MIRISIPFLFMIYDSSSIPISDFCICSYFRIFHIFTNLLYTKNLTNLTNLTILQILQTLQPIRRRMSYNVSAHFVRPANAGRRRSAEVQTVEIQARRGTEW